MNAIDNFFKLKEELDKSARDQGKANALPREILPHLSLSLEEFADSQTNVFEGTRIQLEYLLNAARIMSIFAVWDNDNRWIRSALLALLIEGGQVDQRMTMSYLSLINHSAKKIGGDIIILPEDQNINSPVLTWIKLFNNKTEVDKAIELYGYKEVSKSGRFDFKCII